MSRAVRTRRGLGFSVDLGRCVGCGACVLACRMENGVPAGLAWRRILTLNSVRHPGGPTYFLSLACHHCEDPPCVRGCPSGALEKSESGVVLLDSGACLGCRYCEMACPFGAPAYDAPSGVMTKCHLCHHRLVEGLDPACVAACPTGALELLADGDAVKLAPGFADPTRAGPRLRITPPRGALRVARLAALKARLAEEEESHGAG